MYAGYSCMMLGVKKIDVTLFIESMLSRLAEPNVIDVQKLYFTCRLHIPGHILQ